MEPRSSSNSLVSSKTQLLDKQVWVSNLINLFLEDRQQNLVLQLKTQLITQLHPTKLQSCNSKQSGEKKSWKIQLSKENVFLHQPSSLHLRRLWPTFCPSKTCHLSTADLQPLNPLNNFKPLKSKPYLNLNIVLESRKLLFSWWIQKRHNMAIGCRRASRKLTFWESKQIFNILTFIRGGCALVWLGKEQETGRKVAMKQFSKCKGDNSESTAKVESNVFKILNA